MSDYNQGPEDERFKKDPTEPLVGRIEGEDSWVADEALASLVSERQVHPEETEEQLTRRLFRENSANAALGIIHIAVHGANERTRLDASKYVIERVLGKVGDDAFQAEKSPLESLMEGVLQQAEAFTTAAAIERNNKPHTNDEEEGN